jgi:hypothetical protein
MKTNLKGSLDHLNQKEKNRLPNHWMTKKNAETRTTHSALKEHLLGPSLKHTIMMMMMMIMGDV